MKENKECNDVGQGSGWRILCFRVCWSAVVVEVQELLMEMQVDISIELEKKDSHRQIPLKWDLV